ncbi:EGF-like domain protein [Trichuris suis]|nr:EGF-like domain protein [Trichuris suis]
MILSLTVCATVIDPCESNPCKNNGQCDSANGSYICTCFPGWTGKHCSDVLDPCKDVSCGLGSCEVYNSKPICKCPGQLTGKRCELRMSKCIAKIFKCPKQKHHVSRRIRQKQSALV